MTTVLKNWIGIAALTAIPCFAQSDRITGKGITDQCLASADRSVMLLKAQGKTSAQVEKAYQTALAMCSGVSANLAPLAGTVNVDYTRFALLVARDQISPNLYIGLVQDRSRKLRSAKKSPTWLAAYAHGDADGDLVPDQLDQCPGTQDLTPTNDQGCPGTTPLPPGPNIRDIHAALDAMGMVTSPVCDAAQFPGVSAPLKVGYDNAGRSTYAIAVTKVAGQPAGCVLMYEMQIRLSQGTVAAPTPELNLHIVFRSTENTDLSISGNERQVFRVSIADGGLKKQLYDYARYYGKAEIRVRAVNGNGLTSGFSGTVMQTEPSFGEK